MTEIIIGKPKPDPLKSRMYEAISLILMKAGVIGPDIDTCLEWAFGKGCLYVPIYPDWIDRWHKLHPKAFRVKRKDKFLEWLYVVGFMFCVEKYKEDFKGGKGG